MDNIPVLTVIAAVLSLIGTAALFILVLPERQRPFLSGGLRRLADFLNMRRLMLEAMLKAIYVFLNLLVIISGIFAMFTLPRGVWIGLGMIVLGPVLLRMVHEMIMLRLVTLKTSQEILRCLRGEDPGEAQAEEERPPVRRERMARRQARAPRESARGERSAGARNGQDPRAYPQQDPARPAYGQQGVQPAPPAYGQYAPPVYGQSGERQAASRPQPYAPPEYAARGQEQAWTRRS